MSTQDLSTPNPATPSSDVFVRKSSGLVRAGKTRDALFYNVLYSAGGLTTAFYFLGAPFFYPGSSWLVTMLISAGLGLGLVLLYGMMTTMVPRTGGDYVFVSRVLHPAIGFASNFSYAFWNCVVAGVYGTFIATYCIGAWCRVIAGYTGDTGLLSVTEWLATDWGIFVAGAVAIALSTMVHLLGGPKAFFKCQRIAFYWYVGGAILIPIGIAFFVGHADFAKSFNEYASNLGTNNAVHKVNVAAQEAGFHHAGFSMKDTIYAVSVGWFVYGFLVASNYFAGEIRTGKKTHMFSMLGALVVVLISMAALYLAITSIVDKDFAYKLIVAEEPGAYGFAAGAPAYPELMAIASGNIVLGSLIMIGFTLFVVIWIPMMMMLQSRVMLAWSFDGVMPAKLADVSDRTRAPWVAVLVFAVLGTASVAVYAFTDILTTLAVLFPVTLSLAVVSFTGIVLPFRRPELFEASPFNQRIGRVPVLSIVGGLALAGVLAVLAILLIDPGSGDDWAEHKEIIAISLGVICLVGPAIYYISKYIRSRQGVDLDLAYIELPPE